MKKTLNLGIKANSFLFSILIAISYGSSAALNYQGETIKWVVLFSAVCGAVVLARFYSPFIE